MSKKTLRDIVGFLNSNHFDFYTGYPSAMAVLAALMEEADLRLFNRPKYVVTGADALLPSYETTINRVFGTPVTEQYGMAEFCGNMSKCEYGAFHLDFECCCTEQVPIEGSDSVKLIFTGWGNLAMPFIRYEVGDLGRPSGGQCTCGRHSSCFSSIDGRLEDYVVTPDGRKLIGMNQVLEYAPNAREIQIYQERVGAVEFRMVPAEGFGEADEEALLREFRRRGGNDISVSFKVVESLNRSSSGKLKAVVSKVDPSLLSPREPG